MSLEDYYDALEAQLGSILHTLGSQLSPEESRQVGHFLEVGEYGLALQTLADLLIEQRKVIPPSAYDGIARVAKRMDMEQEVALDDLEGRVQDDI